MKNNNIKNTLLVVAMSSVLAACSNGENTGSTNDTSDGMGIATSDQTAPVITLNGSSEVLTLINQPYLDAGAYANDAVDGQVPVSQSGDVDTSTAGSYFIAYNAIDAAGNGANGVTRTVTVIDGIPIVAPQKLYGVDYDIHDGFEFDEVSINESSISFLGGEVLNNSVMFNQADLSYSASGGQWASRDPASFGFELVDLNTVGVIDGVRKLTIDSIEDISGQLLVAGGNELDSDLPGGSARYAIKTELLEDLYSVERKVSFNGVIAQTLDEALFNSCGDSDLVDYIDSDQLAEASIPCNQINQTSGTLTANTITGGVVTDAGLWSVGKIPGSEIDVLTIKLNPSYLRIGSYQLTEHPIFAIKDGEVWSGELTEQGTVTVDNYYNSVAVQRRILDECFVENADGDYIDC